MIKFFSFLPVILMTAHAYAAVNIPLTVNLSETVNVTGTPRIAVDVGGTTRYATYSSGTGTNALTFTLAPQAGDVDLDGVTVSSPIDLNGGTITDTKGNNLSSLTFTPPSTTNVKVNYPSLGMDFVYDSDGRYTLNGTVYNDLASFLSATGGTFTRASIGTYYDSTGTLQTAASGVPRFDYDPVTHTPKGILIEEQRTNLLTYSSRMDHAAWSFSGTKTIGEIAPDGSSDGTTLSGPTVPTTAHRIITPAITSTSVTYSVFAKFLSGPPVKIFLLRNNTTATNFDGCGFNLSTGSNTSPCTGWVIYALNNGWYRLSYTRTTGISIGDTLVVYFGKTGQSTAAGESWAVWGAQLEAGAFATSYIPTTTTTVTRAADSLTFPTSAWYNASEGAMALQGAVPNAGASVRRFATLSDGTINNTIQLANAASNTAAYMEVRDTLVIQASMTAGSFTAGSYVKNALAYKANDFALTSNGSAITSDSSGSVPTINKLTLGSHNAGGNYINGGLKSFKYYPSRVPNTQLQLLTQ